MFGSKKNSKVKRKDTNSVSERAVDLDNSTKLDQTQYSNEEDLNALALSIESGNIAAFDTLYITLFDNVAGYLYKRIYPSFAAEDAISDTFGAVYKNLYNKKWRDEGKPVGAWVMAIAHNIYCEWARKTRRMAVEVQDANFKYEDVEDKEPSPLDQVVYTEGKDALWTIARRLSIMQYKVLYLRYAQNSSFKEIALIEGKTEENCRKIHQRAIHDLRHLLLESGLYDEYQFFRLNETKH